MNKSPHLPAMPGYPQGQLAEAVELGAVDTDSVRLWVRQPDGAEVTARLEVDGCGSVSASITPAADTDFTGVIELRLPEPAPGRAFVCTARGRTFRGAF